MISMLHAIIALVTALLNMSVVADLPDCVTEVNNVNCYGHASDYDTDYIYVDGVVYIKTGHASLFNLVHTTSLIYYDGSIYMGP